MVRVVLSCLLLALAGSPSTAATIIDFEQFDRGDRIGSFSLGGVGITVFGDGRRFDGGGTSEAMILDNRRPGDDDRDLIPERSINGAPLDANNVLILTEDGDASDPDDNRFGGFIEFTFDRTVRILGVDLLDDISVDISSDQGDSIFQRLPEDNDIARLDLGWDGVNRLRFDLSDSGAIDNLRFDPTPVPLPAGLPLLAAGIAAFAFLRRRSAG